MRSLVTVKKIRFNGTAGLIKVSGIEIRSNEQAPKIIFKKQNPGIDPGLVKEIIITYQKFIFISSPDSTPLVLRLNSEASNLPKRQLKFSLTTWGSLQRSESWTKNAVSV